MIGEGVLGAPSLFFYGGNMKEKVVNYVHRDYNHKNDYVIVIDSVTMKASFLDRIFKRRIEWRFEDKYLKEMWESSHL